MHWATILSALGCALATAYLVLVERWDFMYAGITVVGSLIATCGILLFTLYILSAPEDKADFVRSSLVILRNDLNDLLRMLRLKR